MSCPICWNEYDGRSNAVCPECRDEAHDAIERAIWALEDRVDTYETSHNDRKYIREYIIELLYEELSDMEG